jgi:methyltransferase (TIGR00027 family)
LASTAHWIAAVRAAESVRADSLFNDPWAAALAGTEGAQWLAGRSGRPALTVMAIRARLFDDFVQRATSTVVKQVVLVAAGFDTRGFRLQWPAGVRLFELDQPEVLDRKVRVLDAAGARPTCIRRAVGADLAGEWGAALVDAGFDSTAPSCWLLEGFLFYLPDEAVVRVLDEVTQLAVAGSQIGFDIANTVTLHHPLTRPWIDMQSQLGAPWLGTLDDPVGFLSARGWHATATQPGEPAANYGRWPYPVPPRQLADMPRHWFVTGTRL